MENESTKKETSTNNIDRREFLKLCTLLGGGVILSGGVMGCINGTKEVPVEVLEQKGDVTIVRAACPGHNCGGRCLLKLHIKQGKVIRIETDDRATDTLADPQLRACIRGRAYRRRQYHPDRLKQPLVRVGKRGEGKFEPIEWNEALDLLASEIKRVKQKHGNSAILVPYGTGSYNQLNGSQTAARLMNLIGGSLGYYN
ncbi:MAG: molybdopterin-dependent oxidoreductase, partial [Perlabentimonas sp.]